jgi:polyferredoxin
MTIREASLVGLLLTPILVNVLGGLVFSGHRSYGAAQGLGSLFCFLSIPSAILGALYWGEAVAWLRQAPRSPRRLALLAAIYLLLVLAAVLAIGWNYTWSR